MSAPTTSRPARATIATRGILAALLALHGYAHFVGTATISACSTSIPPGA